MYNAKKRRTRAFQWRDELAKYIYAKTVEVDGWRIGASESMQVRGARFADGAWSVARRGQLLGKINEFIWLRNKVTIPKEFAGGEVLLHIDIEAEGALFGQRALVFVNGVETVGLDRLHKDVPLAKRAKGGEKLTIAVEAYTGPVESFTILAFGKQRNFLSKTKLGVTELRLVNRDAYRLYQDFAAAVDILDAQKEGTRTEAEVLAAIDEAIGAIDRTAGEEKRNASFRAASAALTARLFSGEKGDGSGRVMMMGQSHIDMAWLWPRAETIRKCASTMANTLALQETFDFYRFSHSQAQGFQWIKDLYPNLHERTKKAVRAGKVEAVGGMWVEADLNCAGGEALARQFLYGQKFFEKEFGRKSRVGWLVDTFGYSWAMPQILKESGLDYFVSTKPTWNDTNTFPFTFFWWEGPDGSRVLTHIPPLTYGSEVDLKVINETVEKNKEARLGVTPGLMFGASDGGGGPRVRDIENIPRLAASPYAPRMEIKNVTEFFDGLPKSAAYPVFADEMYVETHRGTYTTQSRTKRNNRKAEYALFTLEAAASAAALLGADYPGGEIEEAWKLALFNQFHDILPGSSLPMVYEDAERDYAKAFAITDRATERALSFVAKAIDTTGPGDAVMVFNPCAWDRTDVVEIDSGGAGRIVTDIDGTPLPCQRAGKSNRLAVLVKVAACGWKILRVVKGKTAAKAVATVTKRSIETDLLTVRLNASGQLASVYDREARREVLAAGEAGNRLEMMEDIPVEYEAWDIDEWADDKKIEVKELLSSEVVENGPVRTVIQLAWKARASKISQRMILYGHTKRIDFETEVDWHERKTLLKAAFPLAVVARRATYEIAFGAIDRSTRQSNPWDWARFEVPAQKWADISQADYGASVLNDCKYGYDAKGHVLRLSLLRSPESLAKDTDHGRQVMKYSLMPHAGDWRAAGTVREGVDFNAPLVAMQVASTGGTLPGEGWLLRAKAADGGPVVVSAFKMAEGGKGYVLRLYEPHGRDTKVTIETPFEIKKAERVNFLEEVKGKVRAGKNQLTVSLSPWKVVTLRLFLA